MTYFVNLHGAKIDTGLSKSAQPCSSAVVSLEFLTRSPVVYSCSDGGDAFPREIRRDEGVGGDPQTTCLPQAKVIFSSACLETSCKDCCALTYIGYSLCPGVGGTDLSSVCPSRRCALSFDILKWRLPCSC